MASTIPADSLDSTKLARGATVALGGKILGRAIHVVSQAVLARMLGPPGYGIYAIGWTILRMVAVVAPLGLDRGALLYLSRHRETNKNLAKGVLWESVGGAFVSGLVIALICCWGAPWLAVNVFHKPQITPALRVFTIAFPFVSALRVSAEATRATQQMRFGVFSQDLTQPSVNLVLLLVFFSAGGQLRAASYAAVGSFVAAFGLATFFVTRLFRDALATVVKASRPGRELFAYAVPVAVATVSTTYLMWVDRLFVGRYLPASKVGAYQAVSQSAVLITVIVSAFSAMFSPMIADLYHQGQLDRVRELFHVATKWALFTCLPCVLVMIIFPVELLSVVFGSEYTSGASALAILSVGQLLSAGGAAVGLLLMMTGFQNRWVRVAAGTLLTNVVLNAVLVPDFGLEGAAFATTVASGLLFVLGLRIARGSLGISLELGRMAKGLAAAVATALSLEIVSAMPFTEDLLVLSVALVTAVMVFSGILFAVGLDREDQDLIGLVAARLRDRSSR